MRSILRLFLMFSMLAGLAPYAAQAADQPAGARRVRQNVTPEYPDVARKLAIHGVVQLAVKVTSEGVVREVTVTGGNPVLVDASVKAVRRWRYEATGRESVEQVRFVF